MKVLLTVKEYAKKEGLTEQAIRKQIVSKLCESIYIDKMTYIIYEDEQVVLLKNKLKNANAKVRELKLKLAARSISSDERYISELNKQIEKLETNLKNKNDKIEKLETQKDTMYEKFLGTIINNKKAIE